MKILVLSFYYEPDLCAGSFRTTALVKELSKHHGAGSGMSIEVISTLPNRYASFSAEAPELEESGNVRVHRVALPSHNSGMLDQAKAFFSYYKHAMRIVANKEYDMVYATSSRLFTAFLGARIARKKNLPLYLDIRDIFVDTIKDVISPKITWAAKPFLSLIEAYAFNSARRINLVSGGFKGYFDNRYSKKEYRWFTNGIDQEFLNVKNVQKVDSQKNNDEPIHILYAGNIGEGQGLHTIIPGLAKNMGSKVRFTVIGDGGRKAQLEHSMQALKNIELLPPVNRAELINAYQQADVLFLHLNDYPAFKKVLPSKIFEYAALGKPILAGVSGFSAEFLEREVDNCAVFYPSDMKEAMKSFDRIEMKTKNRAGFKKEFAREVIMKKMAEDIVEFAANEK